MAFTSDKAKIWLVTRERCRVHIKSNPRDKFPAQKNLSIIPTLFTFPVYSHFCRLGRLTPAPHHTIGGCRHPPATIADIIFVIVLVVVAIAVIVTVVIAVVIIATVTIVVAVIVVAVVVVVILVLVIIAAVTIILIIVIIIMCS